MPNVRDIRKVRQALNFDASIVETSQHYYYLDEDDIGGVIDIYFTYRLPKTKEILKGVLKYNGELQLINCQNCAYYIGQPECEYDNRFIVSDRYKCVDYSMFLKKKEV